MENMIQKHRAFVIGQIQKSFESNIQSSAQEVEKAWNIGDEKQYQGVTYYVGGFNAKGQPLWRKKKDDKTKPDKSNNADPRDKNAQDAGFKDYEEMRGYQDYVTSKNLLKKRSMQFKTKEDTKKELEANVAKYEKEHADVIKRITENKKAKSTKPDNEKKFKENFKDASDDVLQKILDGKIQAGDQAKKWAADIINERKKSGKSESANSKKDSDLINDIKSNEDAFIKVCGLSDLKRVVSIRETPTSVFIKYENKSGQEQEFPLTKNIANLVLKEAKATKSGNKSDKKKADLPFTNLTKHSQVIDYAKTIDGADFEEIDSEFDDKGSKAFRLNYNGGGLKLDVDFFSNNEYLYTFRDKNDNTLYEVRSTRHTDETDWSVMLNPRKWANQVKSNISKHISKRKSEQTRYYNLYSRSGRNSYYDKYLDAKFAIDRFNRSLNKVDEILQLS